MQIPGFGFRLHLDVLLDRAAGVCHSKYVTAQMFVYATNQSASCGRVVLLQFHLAGVVPSRDMCKAVDLLLNTYSVNQSTMTTIYLPSHLKNYP